MNLDDYPAIIESSMVFYLSKDTWVELGDSQTILPKYTLVQIRRKSMFSGEGPKDIQYYLVYYKRSRGGISDASIDRRDLKFYARRIDGLWNDYQYYQQELRNKILLQGS